MGRKKTQSDTDLPPDPNAAITAAIASGDPTALAMALIDRLQVMIGNEQLRNIQSFDRLEGIVTEVAKGQIDVRYQVAESNRLTTESNQARANSQQQVADFLALQGEQLGAVSAGLTGLADEFRRGMAAFGERVTGIEADVGDLKQAQRTINARLSAAERTIDERPAKRAEEQQQIKDAIGGVSAQLDLLLHGQIAQTPEAAQRYRDLLEQLLRERGGG